MANKGRVWKSSTRPKLTVYQFDTKGNTFGADGSSMLLNLGHR